MMGYKFLDFGQTINDQLEKSVDELQNVNNDLNTNVSDLSETNKQLCGQVDFFEKNNDKLGTLLISVKENISYSSAILLGERIVKLLKRKYLIHPKM